MLHYLKSRLAFLLQSDAALFALFLAFAATAAAFFVLGRIAARLENRATLQKRIAKERSDAVKRSRSVLGGLAGEQVAPYLPGFPCNAADARFVGKPIDFVAFPGAAENSRIEEVLLIEVKSGSADLSRREREIRDCVRNGRVRFVEYAAPF